VFPASPVDAAPYPESAANTRQFAIVRTFSCFSGGRPLHPGHFSAPAPCATAHTRSAIAPKLFFVLEPNRTGLARICPALTAAGGFAPDLEKQN